MRGDESWPVKEKDPIRLPLLGRVASGRDSLGFPDSGALDLDASLPQVPSDLGQLPLRARAARLRVADPVEGREARGDEKVDSPGRTIRVGSKRLGCRRRVD